VGGGHMTVSGTLITTLEPGGRHRFLLRPTKWLSVLTYRLAAGKFTAVVHYHGLPNTAADRIRKYRPQQSVLQVWSGDVASPPVSFQILAPPNVTVARDSWGPPSKGLRAAVELLQNSRIAVATPGRFQIQLSGQLPGFVQRDGKGNKLVPLDEDWTGSVTTGFAQFEVSSD